MSQATWDEIKALATDFRLAQESSRSSKLTERNCIDIINYLTENKLIKLYFTNDGKSFLTPEELVKEIYEELEVQNDRVAFNKIASVLDIDIEIIENCIQKMLHDDKNLQIVHNFLINSTYSRKVAMQINEIVKEKGKTNLIELTQHFDLQKSFMEKLIINNLNTIIDASKESDLIFTNAFVRRHTCIIRGYLSRCTKPVSFSHFSPKGSTLSEKLILKIVQSMIDESRLQGSIDSSKTQFIPNVYLQNQKSTVTQSFAQNFYVVLSSLKEFGISNPAKYMEKEFPGCLLLSNCAVGESLLYQFEELLEDVIRKKNCFDCYQLLPIEIKLNDINELVKHFKSISHNIVVLECGYITTKEFIESLKELFDDLLKQRSEEFVKLHRKSLVTILSEESFQNEEKSEDCGLTKSAGKPLKIKSGGGQRGREVKNKTVKNKYMNEKKNKPNNSTHSGNFSWDFMSPEETVEFLTSKFPKENYPENLLLELYKLIETSLNNKFKMLCQSVILQTSDTARNKENFQKLEQTTTELLHKIRLYEKGVMDIQNQELKLNLIRFHLKSICSDLVNLLCEYIAVENNIKWDNANLLESRNKLAVQLKNNLGMIIKEMNKALKEDCFDSFFKQIDELTSELGMYPKKSDKKQDKRLIQEISIQYQQLIRDKIDNNYVIDPAELLLITVLLLFIKHCGYPIHASGKFVPGLLQYLQSRSPTNDLMDWTDFDRYQKYVVDYIKSDSDSEKEQLTISIQHIHQNILDVVVNWRKNK